jgi:hypothetical protein
MSVEDQRRENFAKLAAEIDSAEGAMYVSERRLRDAYIAGKWGERIALAVEADYLPRVGVKLWPGQELWRDQNHDVLLYVEKSPIGQVIATVGAPNRRKLARTKKLLDSEAVEKLARVRALVCP